MALDGFLIRKIVGEYVIIPVGSNAMTFNGIISTNSTGAFLWDKLQPDSTEDDLVKCLTDEYEVSREQALEDVRVFLSELKAHGILNEKQQEKH